MDPASSVRPRGARFDAASAVAPRAPTRQAIDAASRLPEPQALAPLLGVARLSPESASRADALARQLVLGMRGAPRSGGRSQRVQELMAEYALSSAEGVALMCLAEALLRIPDAATRDALIRDKIAGGDWRAHLGHGRSLFVHAATWGLLITGKLVATHDEDDLLAALARGAGRGGEPLVRRAVVMAMRMLGEQFVTGQTIEEAIDHARAMEALGFLHSYDMLGEAALTEADAHRYFEAYASAIHAIGAAGQGRGVIGGPGISVKLSALHPRYSRAQRERVMTELLPRLLALTTLARRYDIGLNIDAEEADRLDLSLDLLDALCGAPALAGWSGIGFVVQAYQKRCPAVIDHLVHLARRSGRRLMVRLVKGAYWDSEIKRAQQDGQAGYPVYTRKHHTDVSYLACARRLLAAGDAVYPQFATHNAHTLAAVMAMADEAGPYRPGQYEFQCLHGMGEPLYRQVVGQGAALRRPCRIYAPVGSHETLLAYLVRRLLENGANSSFVHQMADERVAIDQLVQDPVQRTLDEAGEDGEPGQPHPRIVLPSQLYGAARRNSMGLDLAHEPTLATLAESMAALPMPLEVGPMLAAPARGGALHPIVNPADAADVLGTLRHAHAADIEAALAAAEAAAPQWAAVDPAQRAGLLERAADLLAQDCAPCMALLVREAGKSWPHALAEVREAVDFLRYHASQLKAQGFEAATHVPLGPVLCISPWNFPLAIFVGQAAAALAAGNPVLAKPAEHTSAIAARAVQALWRAGLPRAVLQLVPGAGREAGQALAADARVQGVMFTGSTATARQLQAVLSRRCGAHGQPVPLIAETGGQNAMVVDSSALLEQVAIDAVASAFEAAGQRCSALRVLCVQEEVADRLIDLVRGAMAQLRLGPPAALAADVGPVIDERARHGIEAHLAAMAGQGHRVHRLPLNGPLHAPLPKGHWVAPALVEIDAMSALTHEVFGPVLHVLRWQRGDLPALLRAIAATGYALTLGVHSRIEQTIGAVIEGSRAGNVYVNRNMVGAVVGVQPFGGEGLSGTGPKAGGPLQGLRLLSRAPACAVRRALGQAGPVAPPPALEALREWAGRRGDAALAQCCQDAAACTPGEVSLLLPGPTGERNVYQVRGRRRVLCAAAGEADLLAQLAAVLSVQAQAVWGRAHAALHASLPESVRGCIALADDVWSAPQADAALLHGDTPAVLQALRRLSGREGPIVGLTALAPGARPVPLAPLLAERSISTNTAAAGGNASLMSLAS